MNNIALITIIIISLTLINIGCAFFDIHSNIPYKYNSPIYWPLAIGFSSIGGIILTNIIIKYIIPDSIYKNINIIKS